LKTGPFEFEYKEAASAERGERMSQAMRAPSAKKAPKDKEERLRELVQYLLDLQKDKFTGYLKANFSQGSLSRIEKFEEVLKD
jgi:hypothetical protein